MTKSNLKYTLCLMVFIFTNAISLKAHNIEIGEFIKIVNNQSLSIVSDIVRNKGYNLAYSREYKGEGWEGSYITDVAFAKNVEYNSYSDSWIVKSKSNSYLKMLFNNTNHAFEQVIFCFSSSILYKNYKSRLVSLGFKYQFDEASDDCIKLIYANDKEQSWIVLKEYTDKTFAMYWWKDNNE